MFSNVLFPHQIRGWIVVRTWPRSVSKGSPKMTVEMMQVWESEIETGKFHDAYIGDDLRFFHHVTIFPSYETALKFLNIFKSEWESAVFGIMPSPMEPNYN